MEGEGLLPGLPDDVTLEHIVPQLPWTAFRILIAVSRLWRDAVLSHRVHDTRVLANSTEKLFVLSYMDGKNHEIALFSASDCAWLKLPRYPTSFVSQRGMPCSGQCVSLDGKIYVLGGVEQHDYEDSDDSDETSEKLSSEVYVLDVAGYLGWKKCASMPIPRQKFGCGVADGKLYVFGGKNADDTHAPSTLVYDPKENAWSSVRPMDYLRTWHHVVPVGEELFVHGGRVRDKRTYRKQMFTEVYHPGRDEWRSLEPFGVHELELLFNAKGKLHMTTPRGVYGHAIDSDGKYSWTLQHSFGPEEVDEHDRLTFNEFAMCRVEAINDELLRRLTFKHARESEPAFYRSKGFGSEKKELWDRIVPSEILRRRGPHRFVCPMCPIQL